MKLEVLYSYFRPTSTLKIIFRYLSRKQQTFVYNYGTVQTITNYERIFGQPLFSQTYTTSAYHLFRFGVYFVGSIHFKTN